MGINHAETLKTYINNICSNVVSLMTKRLVQIKTECILFHTISSVQLKEIILWFSSSCAYISKKSSVSENAAIMAAHSPLYHVAALHSGRMKPPSAHRKFPQPCRPSLNSP